MLSWILEKWFKKPLKVEQDAAAKPAANPAVFASETDYGEAGADCTTTA